MAHRQIFVRALSIGACSTAIVLVSNPGECKPKRAKAAGVCTTAYKTAQEREQAGSLREAKDLYQSCAKSSCGTKLSKNCSSRLERVEADIPTVVPLATDAQGSPMADVEVRVDGELIASRLDGVPIAVEPGLHEFTFRADGQVLGSQKLMVVQGEHGRRISVKAAAASRPAAEAAPTREAEEPAPRHATEEKLADEAAPAESSASGGADIDEAKSGGSVLPYVIGGAGVAAIGTGALLILWGKKDNDKLADCSPNCSKASVDHIRNLYTIADISIGAGVVALGVATYLLASGSSREKPPTQSAYAIGVAPTRSGAFASVSGAF